MGVNSVDWLEKHLKLGEIKIQGSRKRHDKAPDANGVLKMPNGEVYWISLWKVRVNEGKFIMTGTFEPKQDVIDKIRAQSKRNDEDSIGRLIP